MGNPIEIKGVLNQAGAIKEIHGLSKNKLEMGQHALAQHILEKRKAKKSRVEKSPPKDRVLPKQQGDASPHRAGGGSGHAESTADPAAQDTCIDIKV